MSNKLKTKIPKIKRINWELKVKERQNEIPAKDYYMWPAQWGLPVNEVFYLR